MDLGLKDKVALVAASSQGLGKATALALAREGARVVISGRHEAALSAAKGEIAAAVPGADVRAIVADVTKPDDIERLVAETVAACGTIHILIANAGGPPPGTFDAVSDEDWQRAFHLTVMSAVRLARAALPHMRRQKWGRIINITSSSVKQPIRDLVLSNSLRMSVVGMAKALAGECAADNITVNTVGPGWTRTDRVTQIFQNRAARTKISEDDIERAITSAIPAGRLGRPEELADVITFLASERASYVTGVFLPVDGGAVSAPL